MYQIYCYNLLTCSHLAGIFIIPDVTLAILGSSPAWLIAAGKLKTWWKVYLEEITVMSDLGERRYLQPQICALFEVCSYGLGF